MTNKIPFAFEDEDNVYAEHHLKHSDATGGQYLSWDVAGVTLFIPEHKFYIMWEEIEAANGSQFKGHDRYGFSAGKYHEFILEEPEVVNACFKMGGIEATFGQATPLAMNLFDPYFEEKYHGPWDGLCSVRIYGAAAEELEASLINALMRYEHRFGDTLHMMNVPGEVLEGEEVDDVVEDSSPIITNIEPLRFYYAGLAQYDSASACISFYRVIEYFSFFTNHAEMKKLRNDPSVSDVEFAKKVLDLVSKDEKGPIFKLVQSIADKPLIDDAQTAGLMSHSTPNALAEALYSFRNSIVHGKFSYGFSLQSTPVLGDEGLSLKWMPVLKRLAFSALEKYGTK